MLGIIINPKSGKNYFRAQRIYLWKLLRKRHQPFAYRVTKYAGHAIELARELVERGYGEILILGGDGTLSEAINGIMRSTLTPEARAKISGDAEVLSGFASCELCNWFDRSYRAA